MKAELYDRVRLDDGTEGAVIEVFGDYEAYLVECPTPDGEHAYADVTVDADKVEDVLDVA